MKSSLLGTAARISAILCIATYAAASAPVFAQSNDDESELPDAFADEDSVDFFDSLDFLNEEKKADDEASDEPAEETADPAPSNDTTPDTPYDLEPLDLEEPDEAPVNSDIDHLDIDAISGIAKRSKQEIVDQPLWGIAVFRGLDKVTARVWLFEAPINEVVKFGKFDVKVDRCNKRPPEEPPNTTAFVEITEAIENNAGNQVPVAEAAAPEEAVNEAPAETSAGNASTEDPTGNLDEFDLGAIGIGSDGDNAVAQDPNKKTIFSGWMFASSPGLNAVEHPVYDVWLIDCKMPIEPTSEGMAENVDDMVDDDVIAE